MLYIVGTPIGNLKDITLRALETLRNADVVACEDTRRSLALLNAYDIKKPLVSYHKFNEKESGEKLIERLKKGENVALVSDAGMPLISDPGGVLVNMLIENGLEFTVVPGPAAFVSALALGGLDSSRFCFLGFLPKKKANREAVFAKVQGSRHDVGLYVAPARSEGNGFRRVRRVRRTARRGRKGNNETARAAGGISAFAQRAYGAERGNTCCSFRARRKGKTR